MRLVLNKRRAACRPAAPAARVLFGRFIICPVFRLPHIWAALYLPELLFAVFFLFFLKFENPVPPVQQKGGVFLPRPLLAPWIACAANAPHVRLSRFTLNDNHCDFNLKTFFGGVKSFFNQFSAPLPSPPKFHSQFQFSPP